MSAGTEKPLVVLGWTIYAHPFFLEQLEVLISQVDRLRAKDPAGYGRKNATKRLAAIRKLVLEVIPEDPSRDEYQQGTTLGIDHRHWRRAKFFQRCRLFFRFRADSKVIVLAWVNDDDTKRAYGSKTDAYRVFQRMLKNGHPPDSWDLLITEAANNMDRLNTVLETLD
ncbi:type II toxin-antitoxin system YhaV family toxin [Synechococcus sp. J7-Johnson]|uniref:type II toxin-antitoxin system YhaV family toxin n=1 Tax=Synechococcus sp. J7-Johnson TaxID=2823737 RepID=UPI0020CE89BC|nr:type II toxin-antitoxin system YhaV family toxin [Synechococcus sp. J7-Johnson]MCP9841511.1 type II toxin-antitoxin system YhaV family toxin [Synechococcus sp. J7-Johnson]